MKVIATHQIAIDLIGYLFCFLLLCCFIFLIWLVVMVA